MGDQTHPFWKALGMGTDYLVRHKTGWRYKREVPPALQPVVGVARWSKYFPVRLRRDAERQSRPLLDHHDKLIEVARKLSDADKTTLVSLKPVGTLEDRLAALSTLQSGLNHALAFQSAIADLDPVNAPPTVVDQDGIFDPPTADEMVEEIGLIRAARARRGATQTEIAGVGRLIARTRSKPSKGLTAMVDTMIEHWVRASGARSTKGIERRRRELTAFFELVGVSDVAAVVPDHVRKWRDHVDKRQASGEIGHKHAVDLFGALKVIFDAAVSYGLRDAPNPFEGVTVSAAPVVKFAARSTQRRAWTHDHVSTVLGVADARVRHYEAMAPVWHRESRLLRAMDIADAFRLLGFHGMRSGELLQMRVADVATLHGVVVLNLTDEGERQSLKTPESLRPVPIHKDALPIVEAMLKRSRGEMLFSSFEGVADPGHAFQDTASDYIRQRAGITDASIVTHGLRHRWRCLAAAVGMPERISTAIMGHAVIGGGDHNKTYLRTRPQMVDLKRWMDRIEILRPDVDLSLADDGG